MLDITTDLGIPSFVAMSHSTDGNGDFVEYGSGSHFDARIAVLRSLIMSQSRMLVRGTSQTVMTTPTFSLCWIS